MTSLMEVKDMSVTYTDETNDRALNSDAPYVPAYARSRQSRKSKGGIKTWMILAPIGVLAVGGVGAFMLMNGEQAAMIMLVRNFIFYSSRFLTALFYKTYCTKLISQKFSRQCC